MARRLFWEKTKNFARLLTFMVPNESSVRFHRLLGDVIGAKVVDIKDTNLVNVSLNKFALFLICTVSRKVDIRAV